MTPYKQVKEFMQAFGQECPEEVIVPSYEVRRLRAKLILEEALETIRALGFVIASSSEIVELSGEPDLIEILDGLCDLDYVGRCGTAIACGISEEQLTKAQNEVHRSNMSKMWTTEDIELGKATRYFYAKTVILPGYKECKECNRLTRKCEEHTRYTVTNPYGKIVKPPSFSPPSFKDILP